MPRRHLLGPAEQAIGNGCTPGTFPHMLLVSESGAFQFLNVSECCFTNWGNQFLNRAGIVSPSLQVKIHASKAKISFNKVGQSFNCSKPFGHVVPRDTLCENLWLHCPIFGVLAFATPQSDVQLQLSAGELHLGVYRP